MANVGGSLKRHPVAGFLAFSHGWTFGCWGLASLLAASGSGTIWAGPAVVAFYVGGAGVFLGSVIMTAAVFELAPAAAVVAGLLRRLRT